MDELHNDRRDSGGLTHRPEAKALVRWIRRGACADIKRDLDATLGRGLANRHLPGRTPRPPPEPRSISSNGPAFTRLRARSGDRRGTDARPRFHAARGLTAQITPALLFAICG